MRKILASALIIAAMLVAAAPPAAHAALQRMGPVNMGGPGGPTSVGGFPAWFQDRSGLTLEFCDPTNQAELDGGWCTIISPQPPTAPESFPNSFFIEHFY